MSTINELPRISDVLMFEEGEEVNYVRDAVIVEAGTAASAIGQVLGQVTATGKFTQLNPAASDGSQNAAAVLLGSFSSALAADTTYVAVRRGPCVLKASGLQWTAGMTNTQIATAQAQLLALGMKVESAFGV
jgi:hypothetical protein